MNKKGFDADKYLEEQARFILERINEGDSERLYLEFGGKLVQDKHAMRVLPGFDENAKIKLLHRDHHMYLFGRYSDEQDARRLRDHIRP